MAAEVIVSNEHRCLGMTDHRLGSENMITARPLRLNYYTRIPNVGDLANPIILEELSHTPTRRVERETGPHLLAAGSIISSATPSSRIWGTGLMHPKYGVGELDTNNVWAVRGKNTIVELRRHHPALQDVPLGDPGILLPELLGIASQQRPRYRIGVAAHYVDRQDPRIVSLLAKDAVLDLNVHEGPRAFLEQMALCEVVVSSSLHGIIFAEALGLPNLWVKVSNRVAGEGFKFFDWYTTTARPQTRPHDLGEDESVEDLLLRCEQRESLIDKVALRDALTADRLESIREREELKFYPVAVCRNRPTPCFLISFNRGRFLKRAIKGLEKQSKKIEIVVHDNGSNDPTTLDILDDLQKGNTIIYRNGPIDSPDDLDRVNETVEDYFKIWAEPQRYLVSDCDIDMTDARDDAIEVFDEALNQLTDLDSVGPMLKISDIPDSYPLRNHALNLHIFQFWGEVPDWFEYGTERLAFLRCRIDTTLGLHRASEPFKRLKKSARFYAPHEARHLDWYISKDEVKASSIQEKKGISHWSDGNWLNDHQSVTLQYPGFFDVSRGKNSGRKITWKRLRGASLQVRHRLLLKRLKLLIR